MPFWDSATVTGDLSKPVEVKDDDGNLVERCHVTNAPPAETNSDAPQFCLTVATRNQMSCCRPTHDVYIREHMQELWPLECS